jgi:hypothetical protein
MSRFVSMLILLCLCLTILFCFPVRLIAQDQNQGLQAAKILEVDQHLEGRMVNYANESSAPVYDRYPYFDLKIQLGSDCYVARYDSHTGFFPAAWKAGSTVQARMEGGLMYLVRYDGAEVPTSVLASCSAHD